jgi:hypothetical protein
MLRTDGRSDDVLPNQHLERAVTRPRSRAASGAGNSALASRQTHLLAAEVAENDSSPDANRNRSADSQAYPVP